MLVKLEVSKDGGKGLCACGRLVSAATGKWKHCCAPCQRHDDKHTHFCDTRQRGGPVLVVPR